MKELFKKENIVNFFLLPVFAIGGFYDKRLAIGDFNLTYVFSTLFILAFVLTMKKNRDKTIKTHLLFLIFAIYIISLINWFNWGLNDVDEYSVDKLIVLLGITFPVCYYVSMFQSENEVIIFFKQISLIGLLLGLLGFVQIIFGGGGETRLAVFGGGPIVFSRWVGLFFIIFLFNFKIIQTAKIIILAVCIVLMLFSGSKGPFFFLLLTFFLIYVRNKSVIAFVGLVFFLIKLNLSSIIEMFSNYPMLIRIFGLDETSSITEGTSSSARVLLIDESLDAIYNNPFGYGLGNFSRYADKSEVLGATGYPHNFFIETWLESGIIIFLIVLVYFMVLFFKIFKDLYKEGYLLSQAKKTMVAIWIFYFLNSMVSGDLSDARFLIVFTALYFVLNNINKKKIYENNLSSSIL